MYSTCITVPRLHTGPKMGIGHPLAVWAGQIHNGLRPAPLRCGPPKVGLENGERCRAVDIRVVQHM